MTDTVQNTAAEPAADHVEAVEPTVVAAVKKVNARRVRTERKPRAAKPARTTARVEAPAATTKEETTMNFDPAGWMNLQPFAAQPFAAMPGADRFQTLFAEAGSRGQEALEKGRKVTEELTELTRANVEAMVEAGRIAATGAKTVGEEALQRTREGLERNVAEFRNLAQAASPSEFFQLQGEIARSNFDRMVASFSQLTESTVKLAGEAVQPLSNRAAVNAEKLNELTA